MKLIILGASGRCGSWVVRLAKERGHDVTAVIRPESTYVAPDKVTLRQGQITDLKFLRSVLTGHQTVISCIGLRRAGLHPWAKLLSPPDLIESVMKNMMECMLDQEASRLIWMSAGGVGASIVQTSPIVRAMIQLGNIGVAYKDLEAAEKVIESTKISSLAVRPVTLISGPPNGKTGQIEQYTFFSTVRRSNVAQWMLDIADGSRSYEGKNILLGQVF